MKTIKVTYFLMVLCSLLITCGKSEKDDPKTQVINHVKKLTASDGADNDYYGYAVSISGDYSIAGACLNTVKGAAYVYRKEWQ